MWIRMALAVPHSASSPPGISSQSIWIPRSMVLEISRVLREGDMMGCVLLRKSLEGPGHWPATTTSPLESPGRSVISVISPLHPTSTGRNLASSDQSARSSQLHVPIQLHPDLHPISTIPIPTSRYSFSTSPIDGKRLPKPFPNQPGHTPPFIPFFFAIDQAEDNIPFLLLLF